MMLLQVIDFSRINFVLQKKNSLIGFSLGIVPIIISALAIELFIGRIIDGSSDPSGFRANNIIIFNLINAWFTAVSTAASKFRTLIKNTPINLTVVQISEGIIITLNALAACVVVNIILGTEATTILVFACNILLVSMVLFWVSGNTMVLPLIFHDYSRIIGIVFQLIFWLSPIIYEIRALGGAVRPYFCLNPLNVFFEINVLALDSSKFEPVYLLISTASLLASCFVIWLFLGRLKKNIAMFY